MTTWKWSVGWTWALFASTGLGNGCGLHCGWPPWTWANCFTSQPSQAEIRPPAALIQAVQQPNRVCQETLTVHTPHPRLAHMHTLFIHHIWPQERTRNFSFSILSEQAVNPLDVAVTSLMVDTVVSSTHVMLGEQSEIEKVSQTFCSEMKISHMCVWWWWGYINIKLLIPQCPLATLTLSENLK